MKRLVLLVLCCCVLSAVCQAFAPAQDQRWLYMGANSRDSFWLDSQSVRFYENTTAGEHSGHQCAEFNVAGYTELDKSYSLLHFEMDLTCRLQRLLSLARYDAEDNPRGGFQNAQAPLQLIGENSLGARYYQAVLELQHKQP